MTLTPQETAQALPYLALAKNIETLLLDSSVSVPQRIVHPLANGGSLFVMPASDTHVAITKLITFISDNASRQLPSIQGDLVIFDAQNGKRLKVIDGPTVTARRTAAVSLLAAQKLAPNTRGKLLIVGAGVQGKSHLEAFAEGLGVREVIISSRSQNSADALVIHAKTLGLNAQSCADPNEALKECSIVVSTTSAQEIALFETPRTDAFVCAVGAFTPNMVEWAPEVCQHIAQNGRIAVDSRDADHEAGDLIQAGLNVSEFSSLEEIVRRQVSPHNLQQIASTVFFKSCGWAGWDLAAARCCLQILGKHFDTVFSENP